MKRLKIVDEMYGQGFLLMVNGTQAEATEIVMSECDGMTEEETGFGDSTFNARYFVCQNKLKDEMRRYLWIENFHWTIVDQARLNHEILHHVCGVMEFVGAKLSDDSEELYAYYMEFIMKKVYASIKNEHPKYVRKRKQRKGTGKKDAHRSHSGK